VLAAIWLPFAVLFEAPLTAAAVAGGVVSIPIVIHLLNRKRFRVVTWAAMRFLLAAQRKNSRRMRLEQLILLAVRCLVVLLLVLAMASVTPWAEATWHWMFPEGTAPALGGTTRTHKILVIDGSFSMALKVGDTTCFEKARALAGQIVRDSPGGDAFSVVLMAAPPRRVVSEPSEDARKVGAEIEAVRQPHGNADLVATFNAVESLLRASPGKFIDREVYFLTDMQKSTWIARQPTALAATLQKIKEKARTIFVDVGQEGVSNLAVTNLTLGDPVVVAGQTTTVIATVHNYGNEPRGNVSASLWVGKARATANESAYELKLDQEQTIQVSRREEKLITFPFKRSMPGDYVVQVRIEGDALDLDNSRSAVITVKKAVPVMLVNGKADVTDPYDKATEWLRLALNPYEGETAPASIVARPDVLTDAQFSDEGRGDLEKYDCVFLCDVSRLSFAETRRLENHLRRGGGVVFCLGNRVDVGAYNEALYRDGTGILPAKLMKKQPAGPDHAYKFSLDEKETELDPLKAFRGEFDRASLLAPRFRQFIRAEAATRGGPRTILSFDSELLPRHEEKSKPPGGPAILEWQPLLPAVTDKGSGNRDRPQRARGRVVLITTPVNADWSTWPAAPSFPALMQELLHFASAGRLRERSVTVGDPVEEFLPTPGGGLDARIRIPGPEKRVETVRTQGLEDASVLRWTDTDVSGIYVAQIGNDPREHLFAVNVPASSDQQESESDLERTTLDELKRVYPGLHDTQVVTDLNQVVRGEATGVRGEGTRNPLGPAIARWLLLVVLALLFVEIVMAWQFGHYTSAASADDANAVRARGGQAAALYSLAGVLFALSLGLAFVLVHNAWTGDFLGFLPESLRRSAEEAMDIPAPAPGEGSHWRLEYSSYLWDGNADPWLAGALAVAALGLVVYVYRREGRTPGTAFRLVLGGLRIGLVLLMLAVILPQLTLWFERQGWPDVAILIDDSQSMSATDKYRDPAIQAAADRLAGLAALTEPDRLRLAQALVTRSDPDWLTTLLNQRKVRLHVYHCSARAHRLNDVVTAEDVGPAIDSIRDLRADPANDSSQLGAAVRQVLNDFRGSSLAAVIMLTDGVTTEGEDLVKASKYAGQMGVPLFFVGLGDAHEIRDVYLHDLQAEDSVYVNDNIIFDVRVTGQGYNNLSVPVELVEKATGKVLQTATAKLEKGKSAKVTLVHRPKEPGEKLYVIRTPKQPDEVDEENNRLEKAVFVQESRLIKVLYVEGYRRYEYHYVKTLLERESDRTKGNKSIDLKVLLMEADPDFAAQDRSAISEFPPRSVLNTFDVVILGDVDPRPRDGNKMDEHLKDLADFVRERGGGLLMIAGERYAPHAFKDSALKDVLPIEMVADHQPDEEDQDRTEGYRPELTPVGRLHPIFRFNNGEKDNDEIWNHLREMYWWSEGYRIKRAAEVLAVHTKARRAGKEGAAVADRDGFTPDKHPLVVQQFVGGGRCLFFGFNETWRWGFREDQLRFNQFWIQTVRYLARSRLGRIDLRLDRPTPYRRGEPIKMTVRFPDDQPPPAADTEVKVVVERRTPAKGAETEVRTVQLAKAEGTRASYEAVLTRTPEGDYKFWLSQPAAPNPKPRAECKVLAPPGEMDRLRMNQADMERAADESHGRFYTLAEADHLPDDLPSGTRVTLNAPGPPWLIWNHALLFFVALLYLTTEWLMRKQKNLL
jgi:hypothetical protein